MYFISLCKFELLSSIILARRANFFLISCRSGLLATNSFKFCLSLNVLISPSFLSDEFILGFPVGSDCKESACNVGDLGLIPGLGRAPGERNCYPPTPVFLPGEFQGQRSLGGYSPWDRKESNMTELLTLHFKTLS